VAFFFVDKGIKSFVNRSSPSSNLADGRGLYLLITQTHTAIWRIKYRIEGKEKSYSIGGYPQNSLAQARLELNEVLKALRRRLLPRRLRPSINEMF